MQIAECNAPVAKNIAGVIENKGLKQVYIAEKAGYSPQELNDIIVSFENATMPDIARYEENDEGGTFYPGDDEKSYSSYGIFVNAWMPLPEPYRQNDEGAEK